MVTDENKKSKAITLKVNGNTLSKKMELIINILKQNIKITGTSKEIYLDLDLERIAEDISSIHKQDLSNELEKDQ
jgi:hypothetical protein